MLEPDVTLTDYALAVECAVLSALIARWRFSDPRQRFWWVVMFASVGVGSLVGGTVHGFFPEGSRWYTVLWTTTLLAIGVTSVAMWIAAANASLRDPARVRVALATAVMLAAYAFVVLFVSSRFVVAIAMYLPAALFLLVAFTYVGQQRRQHCTYGIAGIALTFVAAVMQQARIALHPVYVDHNAFYHLIQGGALILLFLGARQLLEGGRPEPGGVSR